MLLDDILNQREAINALGRRYGAVRISVFGSVARRQESADSDVDFLVDLPRGYDLFTQRLPLAQQLSDLLARPVDVIPEHELNPHMRQQVQQEAVALRAQASHGRCMRCIFKMPLAASAISRLWAI